MTPRLRGKPPPVAAPDASALQAHRFTCTHRCPAPARLVRCCSPHCGHNQSAAGRSARPATAATRAPAARPGRSLDRNGRRRRTGSEPPKKRADQPDLNTRKLSGPRMNEMKLLFSCVTFAPKSCGRGHPRQRWPGCSARDERSRRCNSARAGSGRAQRTFPMKTCHVGLYLLSISRLISGAIRLSTGSCGAKRRSARPEPAAVASGKHGRAPSASCRSTAG